MKNSSLSMSNVNRFLRNVSKLDLAVHTKTSDATLGTVSLYCNARVNNGKRLYSVSSKVIKSGRYTAAGLRKAYTAKVAA